jgi:hypothetical protein
MTHGARQVWAIALGAIALASSSPLCTASADTSTPSGATAARYPAHAYVRHYAHHTHYAWRNGHNDVYVQYHPYTNPYYPYTNVYGSSLKGVGKSELGAGLAAAAGGSRLA